MKAKEIRELSTADLEQRLTEESDQNAQLKFQHSIADLQNPMVLRDKRRLVARLKTILKERQSSVQEETT